jgi:cobalt/nickel transport system permease protein
MLVGALAGGMGTFMAALLLAALLALAGDDFFGVAKLALAAHVPVIGIEALVTGFTVSFLFRVKPDMLIVNRFTDESRPIEEERA